jgi:P4 family phage/plasmid primase-like protien
MTELLKRNNLRIIKKQLMTPTEFRKTDYINKACFSYDYKKYGCFENWEVALEKLNNLPNEENLFHELILEGMKVKPYLDIEWYQEAFINLCQNSTIGIIIELLISLFKKEWDFILNLKDICIATCHRKTSKGFKYSYRIVISTNPTIVFKSNLYASYIATRLQELLEDYNKDVIDTKKIPSKIIDISPYKKTQNIRLIGHCKNGEFIPFQRVNNQISFLNYIITQFDYDFILIESGIPEKNDTLYKDIKNILKIKDENNNDYNTVIQTIIEKVKLIHPSVITDNLKFDDNGFLQLNYKDRKEPCFCSSDTNDIFHEKIGFFCYIYSNLIRIGCHSAQCVDNDNKKIIKILGSLPKKEDLTFEEVNTNNQFNIDHNLIIDCIRNDALGISNLFAYMYTEPKRIKWIPNGTRNTGTSYFWNGKIWKEDDFSYIERLLVITVVNVLRKFNTSLVNDLDITKSDDIEELIGLSNSIIKQLNGGKIIRPVLNFFKPFIKDEHFGSIKNIHPHFISAKNGMICLKTGNLRLAVPGDNITCTLDTNYNENADTELFDNFIIQITSTESGIDYEMYNYIKWTIGYSIQGNPNKKLFFVLYGPHGYNGKSMLLNTINDVLEFYTVSMDKSVVLDNGTKKTAGSHSTELMQLENRRIGILTDTKEDAIIEDGQIKQLTSITDKISARQIYGEQKEFTPTFVPFICTNNKIRINLSDDAMYQRISLIPFELSFVDTPTKSFHRRNDPDLVTKFKNNKESILKWIIDASIYYHSNPDLDIPKRIIDAKNEYKKEMNNFLVFIESTYNYVTIDQDIPYKNQPNVKRLDILYQYKEYCKENSLKYEARKAESNFDNLLVFTKIGNSKCYMGIIIKDEDEDEVSVNDD